MSDLLRILFGSGWMILWHAAMWLVGVLFIFGPLWMLVQDAVKVPKPTASLGTFAYAIVVPVVLAVPTLVNAGLYARSCGVSVLASVGVGAGAALVLGGVTLAALLALGSQGGRVWAGVAVLACVGAFGANLWASAQAQARWNSAPASHAP